MAKATSPTFIVEDGDTIQLKGAHPWRNSENENGIIEDYTHWSIAPTIGFNYFDGDFSSEKKHAFAGKQNILDLTSKFCKKQRASFFVRQCFKLLFWLQSHF
jgi:hypothetical protein